MIESPVLPIGCVAKAPRLPYFQLPNSLSRIASKGSDSSNLIEKLLTGLAFFLLGLAILPLGLVISYVIVKGLGRFNLALFTEIPPTALQEGGGVASAIAGLRPCRMWTHATCRS